MTKKRAPARKKKPMRARAPSPRPRKKAPPHPKQRVPKVPAKSRKSGPKPPKPRAPSRGRSDAERAKAYRYKKRLRSGDGLTPQQAKWLELYEHRVDTGKRARGARSKSAEARGARGDAEDIADRLAAWLGGRRGEVESTWQRTPAPGKPGTATATAAVDWEIDRSGGMRDALPPSVPLLMGALGPDRALTLRVQIRTGWDRKGNAITRWATAVAFTERDFDAEVDFADAVEDIADAYGAEAVVAVGVYVGGFS